MDDSLQPGMSYSHRFTVTEEKTVPRLYPEAEELQVMPRVFATGYLVGLLEWACIAAVNPYLDQPAEQTVGIAVDIRHMAATPPGLEITATVELIERDGRKLTFSVMAHDGVDLICRGRHERFVIDKERFDQQVSEKRAAAS